MLEEFVVQIGILEASDFSNSAIAKLNTLGQVSKFDGGELSSFLLEKEVLFVRLRHLISADFMNMAKNLKYLCSPTTGLNHIDLQECKAKALWDTNAVAYTYRTGLHTNNNDKATCELLSRQDKWGGNYDKRHISGCVSKHSDGKEKDIRKEHC